MFGQFLKPRWQHRDPKIRIRAIAQLKLNDAEQQKALTTMARGDADASVRTNAVARLTDFKLLDQIQQHDVDGQVRAAAGEQINRLLAGVAENSPNLENRLRLIRLTDNHSALMYVAQHSADSLCREAAVERIQDQQALKDIAVSGADEPLRVAATARVKDAAQLRHIIRDARDKRVQRLAREQLKNAQAQLQQAEHATERREKLLQELKAHTTRALDNLYAPRLEQLQKAWNEVASDNDPAAQRQAAQFITECQDRLDEIQRQKDAKRANEQAQIEQQATLNTLQQIAASLTSESWLDINSLRALVATQRNRWDAAVEILPPSDSLAQKADVEFSQWQQAFDCLAQLNAIEDTSPETDENESEGESEKKHINEAIRTVQARWPSAMPIPASLSTAIKESVEETTSIPAKNDTKDSSDNKELVKSLQKVLGTLQKELRQKNLKHANRLWRKAEALLAEDDAPDWQNRLDKMRPELDELRDWHSFAASPKKVELCERMEALIESPMEAEEKAGLIHALHDEWRELMSADQATDQDLWERFRAASDVAYIPCKEYFREQDAERSANVTKRKGMLTQLNAFIAEQDWQHADWKQVFEIRRTAPQEWSSYQPVHFTENRELGRKFSTLLTTLDEKLQGASDAHVAELEALLAQAEALVADSTQRDSIDRWKALQTSWKNVGWVHANRYRALHRKFRKLGDTLFAQLDSQRKEYKQEMQQQESALKKALNELNAMLNADNSALDVAAISQHAEQVHDLPCPPREKALEQQRQDLLQKSKQLKQWQTKWKRWQALQQGIESAPEVSETDAQRHFAVAIEFATGSESPADAKEERMQWQLQQLQKAMKGSNTDVMSETVKTLEEHAELLATGLASEIRERALRALRTLEPKR